MIPRNSIVGVSLTSTIEFRGFLFVKSYRKDGKSERILLPLESDREDRSADLSFENFIRLHEIPTSKRIGAMIAGIESSSDNATRYSMRQESGELDEDRASSPVAEP
jgi:hypothetical protein